MRAVRLRVWIGLRKSGREVIRNCKKVGDSCNIFYKIFLHRKPGCTRNKGKRHSHPAIGTRRNGTELRPKTPSLRIESATEAIIQLLSRCLVNQSASTCSGNPPRPRQRCVYPIFKRWVPPVMISMRRSASSCRLVGRSFWQDAYYLERSAYRDSTARTPDGLLHAIQDLAVGLRPGCERPRLPRAS